MTVSDIHYGIVPALSDAPAPTEPITARRLEQQPLTTASYTDLIRVATDAARRRLGDLRLRFPSLVALAPAGGAVSHRAANAPLRGSSSSDRVRVNGPAPVDRRFLQQMPAVAPVLTATLYRFSAALSYWTPLVGCALSGWGASPALASPQLCDVVVLGTSETVFFQLRLPAQSVSIVALQSASGRGVDSVFGVAAAVGELPTLGMSLLYNGSSSEHELTVPNSERVPCRNVRQPRVDDEPNAAIFPCRRSCGCLRVPGRGMDNWTVGRVFRGVRRRQHDAECHVRDRVRDSRSDSL